MCYVCTVGLICLFLSSEKGEVKLLTKGDNNSVDDRGLYSPGQLWVRKSEVVGRAKGYALYY